VARVGGGGGYVGLARRAVLGLMLVALAFVGLEVTLLLLTDLFLD
jgi:hypothetical protein